MIKTKLVSQFILMFIAVAVFTLVDWLVHSGVSYLGVPSWYFRNKLIFGTIYAFVVSLFVARFKPSVQAAIVVQ